MALDVATLGIKIDASGAITSLGQVERGLAGVRTQADHTTGVLGKLVGAFAAYRAGEWAKETLLLGARYETLGVVMDIVGRNAGKSAAQMQQYQKALEETGISGIGAREALARMAGAQLDLANASKLARVAQDAAVIANMNSTQAYEQLIEGINTGMPRVLRTMGIYVDFEAGQKTLAKTLGKTAEQLTMTERVQANMNTALAGGVQIAGTYEAAMGTAGKQLNSTVRYMEDAREKASRAFQPEVTQAVFAYANALKWLGENAHVASGAIVALTGSIVAATVALKGSAILALFGPEAASLLVAASALALIGVELGTAAANAALARRETQEYYDTLKAMSDTALRNKLQGIKDAMQKGVDAKTYLELQQKQDDVEAELTRRAQETTKAKRDQKPVIDELLAKAQEELAKSEKQLAFDRTHLDMLVRMNVVKEQNNRITEDATDKAKRLLELADKLGVSIQYTAQGMMTIARVSAGINPGIQGGLAMPKSNATPLDIGRAPGWENVAGINSTDLRTTEQIQRDAAKGTSIWKQFAADREEIEKNFLRGLQESFARTFENIFTHGIRGFKDLFASFGTLVAQAAAQLASSGLTTWIKDTYNQGAAKTDGGGVMGGIGNVLASANPLAIFGAATVAVVSFGNALAKAAKALDEARNTWLQDLQTQNALAAQTDAVARERASIEAARAKEIDKLVQTLLATRNLEFANPANFLSAPSTDQRRLLVEARARAQDKYDTFGGESFKNMIAAFDDAIAIFDQLQIATDRANRTLEERIKLERADTERSLRARELRAFGLNDEADALALFNQQVREFADAVKAGWSPEMLAYLGQVQELERKQRAAAKATQEAADAAQALADGEAELARRRKESEEALAAMAARTAEFSERIGFAMESLGIRLLRAQGRSEEADRRALVLQQAQETRAAQREMWAMQSEWEAIQKKRWGGGVTQEESMALGAQQRMLEDMMMQQIAYLKELKTVQAAELAAYLERQLGAGLPAASAAKPGTAGSFGTIVSRATAAQGDRMVDELTTARVLAQKYWPYLKVIADKLTGGVDALLGSALASAQTLSGSAAVT